MHVIRRYSNRKFYDTVQSRYVSLKEINDMYLSGVPLSVLNDRNEDITQWVLYQAVTKAMTLPMRQKVLELVRQTA